MSFEETVRSLQKVASGIFKYRWQVLEHLFVHYGNGFNWVDGRFNKDLEEENEEGIKPSKYCITSILEKKYGVDLRASMNFSDVSERYSYLVNYPDDISPDWKAGIEETVELIKKTFDQADFDEVDETTRYWNREKKENKELFERLGFINKKKYKCKQPYGYALLSGNRESIDPDAEYYIDCYSPTCDNRPVIVRCDGQAYEGVGKWVVDEFNLIEVE